MKKDSTPKALRILRWFCPPHLLEEIEGDLMQQYDRASQTFGKKRARRKLMWSSVRYFRPGIIFRNKLHKPFYPSMMWKNYLKVGFRNLVKHSSFSVINILGLALGITCTALVMMWVQDELSYDRFYPDNERIFQAWNRAAIDGTIQSWKTTPRVLAPTLKEEYPEVEEVASYADWQMEFLFDQGDKKFKANKGPVTETSFLDIFKFPLKAGNHKTALDDPFSIVLTETFSNRLFGDRNAMGESVHVKFEGNEIDFQVTGVLHDLPGNTSFDFDYLISWELFKAMGEEDSYWGNNSVDTFVKLQKGTSLERFNQKIRDIESRHTNGEHTNEIFLYPFAQQHLYSKFTNGIPDGGRIELVRLFEVVAGFILLISCINFINLSTARSEYRTKEVGIRKSIGAKRSNLVIQFLTESALIATLAGLISLLAIQGVLPYFNFLTGKNLVIDYMAPQYWGEIAMIVAACGLLAGSYPAFLLSSFRPVHTLQSFAPKSKSTLRQALVVFQFSFAMILVVATLVVRDQIKHAADRDVGYDQNRLIYFPLNGDLSANYPSFKDELLETNAAISISKTYSPLTQIWSSTDGLEWQGKDPNTKIDFDRFSEDEDLVATAGLELVAGRDIDLDHFPTDSSAALINEAAAAVMKFENPIGQYIKDGNNEMTIVGVVKNLIVRSPYRQARPMLIMGGGHNWFYTVHLRLNNHLPLTESLAQAERVFKKYCPDYPFEFHFIDSEYQQKFSDEKRIGHFATVFGIIAIVISCLGVFGLSLFIIQKRVREIGIRKVFGASVLNVVSLLMREPIRLVLIAFALAVPVSYFIMQEWLADYEYRIDLGWRVFAVTGLVTLLITWLTVSVHTLKSAMRNPVDTLKHE